MMRIDAYRYAWCTVYVLLFWSVSFGQNPRYSRNVLEIKGGVGGTFFFGDLGGSHGEGKAGFFDMDFESLRGNSSFGLKFNLNNRIGLRTDFAIAQIAGSDAYSGEQSRFERNLSFRSEIYELTVTADWVLFNLASLSHNKRATSEIYGFVGWGVIRFDPEAYYEGHWYRLQPLGTEGQGIKPNTRLYSLTSWVLPYGVGYRKSIGDFSYVGVEFSMRKSFTDYLDDVSTVYYDANAIGEHRGEVAQALSNRSVSGRSPDGAMRGNALNNDNYGFIQITYGRSIGRRKTDSPKIVRWRSGIKCPQF